MKEKKKKIKKEEGWLTKGWLATPILVECASSFCVFIFFALKIGFLWGFLVFGLWVFLFSLGLLQKIRFRLWAFAFMKSSRKKEI
jgi:hypothetical protein